jgi:hypothetical protein
MKYNQLLLTFVAITFPIVFKSLPANAFNLIYNPTNSPDYLDTVEYITPNSNKGKVWIDQPQKISPPSLGLLQAFKSQFPLYNFEASYTPIYGDFVVNSYRACPPAPNPGFCPDSPSTARRK